MHCKIFIFRHAQSTDNKRKIFSGWRDPALTAEGRRQAFKIRKALAKETIDVAFTTTRRRASETLKIALGKRKNVPIVIDDRLIERSYGYLQGKNKVRAAEMFGEKRWQRIHRGYATDIPGGESIKMVEKRVDGFIRELERFLEACPCNVAISCHGNSMRPLRRWYQHLSKKEEMALENPQDTDIEVDFEAVPNKRKAHQCVSFGHKHVKGGKVCVDKRTVESFFPGRRTVKVLLPEKLKPRF